MTPSILLLQARYADDPARVEEVASFAAAAGVPVDAVTPWDMLTAVPQLTDITQHDILMIGGSGDYYVSKRNLPQQDAILDCLRAVAAAKHPTFASCFGFQLLVQALGGEIIYSPESMEVGTYTVTKTAAAASDPIFATLPDAFPAQLGRKDRAVQLSPQLIHLAGSELCPYQAVRVVDAPIWAVQFHPELTLELNLGRFKRYYDGYAAVMDEATLAATLASFRASIAANGLIQTFMDHVVAELDFA